MEKRGIAIRNGVLKCGIGTQQGDEYRKENTGNAMSERNWNRNGNWNYTLNGDIRVVFDDIQV